MNILATPLGWVMKLCYEIISNYGIALLLFTFITRLVVFPLNIKQQKSTARMAMLNPQLEKLNEVLDNMTDEELNRRVHEIQRKCYGLDPDDPESPKRMKKINITYKISNMRNLPPKTVEIFSLFLYNKISCANYKYLIKEE